MPCASRRTLGVPTRLDRFTENVSFGSSTASPVIATDTTLEAEPFASVTVPDAAVKSVAVAEPGAVAQFTWSGQHALGGGAAWIVKFALTEPPVPSVTVTSVIVTAGTGAAVAGEGSESISRPAATAAPKRRRIGPRDVRSVWTFGRVGAAVVGDVMAQTSGDDSRGWIPVPGHSACLRGGACAAREGGSGDLASEPTPLLLRQPTPHAVALPVLQRPGEALRADHAGAAERERRSRLLLGDRKKTSGSIP